MKNSFEIYERDGILYKFNEENNEIEFFELNKLGSMGLDGEAKDGTKTSLLAILRKNKISIFSEQGIKFLEYFGIFNVAKAFKK